MFQVTLQGQPPSTNHLYHIVYVGRHPRMAKKPEIETYQVLVTYLVRAAKPSGWVSGAHVRLLYDFFLKRDIDCDNALKAMNDAIAIALDVNDKLFLPCVRSKTIGVRDPHVLVEID
jgi:Holliday junction resolvase RusA-like endonuclease